MSGVSNDVCLVSAKEFRQHIEPQHVPSETGTVVFRIPLARNLGRIILIKHRIEKRLLRQSRWKLAKSAGTHQFEFPLTHRTIDVVELVVTSQE